MKYQLADGILALTPGAEWVLRGLEYSGLEWIRGNGHEQPSIEDVNAKVAELDAAEPMTLLRQERDRRLAKTDWRAGSDLTLSSEWAAYRQALRDLPATATPTLNEVYELDMTSVTWPTEPS